MSLGEPGRKTPVSTQIRSPRVGEKSTRRDVLRDCPMSRKPSLPAMRAR